MKVSAVHKNARMAPRKIRPLARLVRGMPVQHAITQLQFLPGKAPGLIRGVLQSAIANATHNHDLKEDTLTVSQVLIDEGIVMRRFNPVSRGMAHPIKKRTSHVTVIVDGGAPAKKKKQAKAAIEEISAEDYAATQVKEENEGIEEEVASEGASGKGDSKKRPVAKEHDKADYEVFQKKKMQQQGGDKKKTHRRKSIG